ncbi:hypothetical protein M406DRAFT_67786 [Cryphonectria parasitica EP155]|uniref:Uncharacterized protein n=1 Tax=Cryphonectria parasitica (strain ATCC 38755 / EP155) TaxID=660469 RepID=A0A9P4Y2C0_CRYP1|nr:uncharacterized protein M406DRAFT_67786 [Cryphonectria parasitica EP155]KAF3765331.1 hypothetical protein M406DRAFT_67786 [Cryphonectria parasitica EP155]
MAWSITVIQRGYETWLATSDLFNTWLSMAREITSNTTVVHAANNLATVPLALNYCKHIQLPIFLQTLARYYKNATDYMIRIKSGDGSARRVLAKLEKRMIEDCRHLTDARIKAGWPRKSCTGLNISEDEMAYFEEEWVSSQLHPDSSVTFDRGYSGREGRVWSKDEKARVLQVVEETEEWTGVNLPMHQGCSYFAHSDTLPSDWSWTRHHGKQMRPGWASTPCSLRDRINGNNNILIETRTSNFLKHNFAELGTAEGPAGPRLARLGTYYLAQVARPYATWIGSSRKGKGVGRRSDLMNESRYAQCNRTSLSQFCFQWHKYSCPRIIDMNRLLALCAWVSQLPHFDIWILDAFSHTKSQILHIHLILVNWAATARSICMSITHNRMYYFEQRFIEDWRRLTEVHIRQAEHGRAALGST